jgi:hypothetical protein
MKAKTASPEMMRSMRRIASALMADPSLVRDEMRLAALIRDQLEVDAKIARIPACLREER